MTNYETIIGTNAGIIWTTLSDCASPISITRLKTLTNLKDKEFFMALGWLARENKLHFIEGSGNAIQVQLTNSEYYL